MLSANSFGMALDAVQASRNAHWIMEDGILCIMRIGLLAWLELKDAECHQ